MKFVKFNKLECSWIDLVVPVVMDYVGVTYLKRRYKSYKYLNLMHVCLFF
jgi:hypothetical protein